MHELRSPDAYVACLMLERESWSMDSVKRAEEEGRRLISGGAIGAVAAAIGGQAGWVDGERYLEWLRQGARDIEPQGSLRYGRAPGTTEPVFVLLASTAFRDAAWDFRSNERMGPRQEYVFCVSDTQDCDRLGALRQSLGLSWSEENLEGCALALIQAMDEALSRGVEPGALSACVSELMARLALVEAVRPQLLEFGLKWSPSMSFPAYGIGVGCVAFEEQGAGDEECVLAKINWGWAKSAPSCKERSDFPWGFWLAWTAPSLLRSWGQALGARWGADAQLAREASLFQYDRDEWSKDETETSAKVALMLEREELDAAMGPGRSEAKKSL